MFDVQATQADISAQDFEKIPSSFLTIKQFCSQFPWPSESAMRSYIFKAEVLGMQDAFFRCGRRVIVSPKKFFESVAKRSQLGGKHEKIHQTENKGRPRF